MPPAENADVPAGAAVPRETLTVDDPLPATPVLEGEVLPKKTWVRNPEKKGVFVKGDPRLQPGRRKGAKNKLSGDFIKDLAKWYKKDGYKAIERVAREKPDKLLDIIASMVPKEAQVDVAVTHGGGIVLGSVELQEAERRTFDLLRRIEDRVDSVSGQDGPVLPADVGVRQG